MRTTMNWTTKGVAALATGTTLFCGMGTVTAVALTGHHGTAPAAAAAPARTATPPAAVTPPAPKATVPAPTKTIYVTPPAPQALPPKPVAPAAPVQPQFTNSVAVVSQFYQDITDHNYAAAWALGGKYIGGQDYSSWVAGYSTTASVSLYSFSDWGSGKVTTYLSALQSDGTTRTYYGTYYVSNGVIISASIAQTS
jgi:hypothetical protein